MAHERPCRVFVRIACAVASTLDLRARSGRLNRFAMPLTLEPPNERPTAIASERLRTSSRLFAFTRWDAIPVLAGILHCAYFFAVPWLFTRVPFWVMLPL